MCRSIICYFLLLVYFYTRVSNSSKNIGFKGKYTPREHPSPRYESFGDHFLKGIRSKTQLMIILRQYMFIAITLSN